MEKGYSLVVEVEKDSYAVLRVTEAVFSEAKKLYEENSPELENYLEASVPPDNVIAAELSAFEAAGIANNLSIETQIIRSK